MFLYHLPSWAHFASGELFYKSFEFATKNSPISGWRGSCQLLTTLFFKMFKNSLGFSIRISWNRCKNQASRPQLSIDWHQAWYIWLKLKMDASWRLFTRRSNDIRGREVACNFSEVNLLQILQLVEKSVYKLYNQSEALFHMTFSKQQRCCSAVQFCARRPAGPTAYTWLYLRHLASVFFVKWRNFWGHDAIGLKKIFLTIILCLSRFRSLYLLLISWKRIRNCIFSTRLWSNYGIASKKNFQSKNSNWSKQTAAKVCLQDRRRGFLLHIVSNSSGWKKFITS